MSKLVFQSEFEAQVGVAVAIAPGIARVTADNASPYTFTGTNSYVLGTDVVALVDPGPASPAHRAALLKAVGGRPVSHILLTHTHLDHSACAVELARHFGALLVAQGPHRLARSLRPGEDNPYHHAGDWDLVPDILMKSGDRLAIDGLEIVALETPGHCANHVCFEIAQTPYVLSGDLVMGWATTMIAPPDGRLADYYASLERMEGLAGECYLTGHGAEIADGKSYIAALRAHRLRRHEAILGAIKNGCGEIGALRAVIYPKLAAALAGAAESTLLGHLDYMDEAGEIVLSFDPVERYSFYRR